MVDRNPGPAGGTGEMGGQGIPLEQGLWGSSEADEGGGGSRAKPPRGGTGGTARHTGTPAAAQHRRHVLLLKQHVF